MRHRNAPKALISLHDVMPETRAPVTAWLKRLHTLGLAPVTLLVVPGVGWDRSGVAWLRGLQDAGHELAGHGWVHRVAQVRGWHHRLHSTLISAAVAEHLALDPDRILALLHRCHGWFSDHGLAEPASYVPPAWALGALRRAALTEAPFRFYETLSGVYDAGRGRHHPSPLLGFEARHRWQTLALRATNAVARCRAMSATHLRIAIHPRDDALFLSTDLEKWLNRPLHPITYRHLFGAPCMSGERSGATA